MKKYIIIIASAILLTGAAAWLHGQSSSSSAVTIKQPQPEVLVLNTATPVKIAAVITGDVIPGGANLIRLGANGQSTVLGQLTPDPSVSPNGYSITQTFREPVTGTIQLQLSVAIRGTIRRVMSQPFLLAVSTQSITLPPDPGEAGKATLEGIDSNGDGVRDDVERYIVFTVPESEKHREALKQQAIAIQRSLLIGPTGTQQQAIDAAISQGRAIECLHYLRVLEQNRWKEVLALMLNTKLRIEANDAHGARINGQVFGLLDDERATCAFNPDLLPN